MSSDWASVLNLVNYNLGAALYTGWSKSKEKWYFFDFYLIDCRLALIFIPHILGVIRVRVSI